MCYATKRKIADCIKRLMRRQDISKITIQDVMDETGMSRQSFYYHFKDIYDVLEWIAQKDFAEPLMNAELDTMEKWICELFRVIDGERSFYEKLVSEIEWPRIIRYVKTSLQERVLQILAGDKRYEGYRREEWNSCMDIFSTAFGYYVLDYIYYRKHFNEKKVIEDTRYIMMILENGAEASENRQIVVFPKTMVM